MAEDENKEVDQAAIVAHQIKSPISSLQTIIRTLLGGFTGELSDSQRQMLESADRKCSETVETVKALLAIADARAPAPPDSAVDVVDEARRTAERYREKAEEKHTDISVVTAQESLYVPGRRSTLSESLSSLVDNALTYTPEEGTVRVEVRLSDDAESVRISVEDSGIGIPDDQKDRLFEPFFRADNAEEVASQGTGLGLPFVKAVVEGSGGRIRAGHSDLGGAQFTITLPRVAPPAEEEEDEEPSFRVVVIGGVAAGPKIAAKVKRLQPEAEVTIVEKGRLLSYAGCGMPYYISGVVQDQRELVSTHEGVLRGPDYFQRVKNVTAHNQTEAEEINLDKKRVRVRDLVSDQEQWLDFDKLAMATGATPDVPPLPGVDLDNIFTLHGVKHAEGIRQQVSDQEAKDVVIVGGGLLGVEMTESLVSAGCRVTLVEKRAQLLDMLDREMADRVHEHLEQKGVRVALETEVTGFEGQDAVDTIRTSSGAMPADMVILGTGVSPEVELAREAGLQTGPTGALKVDENMQTSHPDVYAAGDCVETRHLVTGKPHYLPLGSTATKQARVAAVNLCGGDESFPGVTGTAICSVLDYTVARSGLTEKEARREGYQPVSSLTAGPDRAHFMPGAKCIIIKLTCDAESQRLLGVQVVGEGEASKRVDIAVTAITAGMTVGEASHLDLAYAPPYAEAMDNFHTACNVLKNKLDGYMEGIRASQVKAKIDGDDEVCLLDVRPRDQYEERHLQNSINMPLAVLRGRLRELPRDQEMIVYSNVSQSAYEANIILRANGFDPVKVMDGGLVMWPFETVGK